jgi:hypothetical protein
MSLTASLSADYADFTDSPQTMLKHPRSLWMQTGDFVVSLLICVNLRNLRTIRVFNLEGAL